MLNIFLNIIFELIIDFKILRRHAGVSDFPLAFGILQQFPVLIGNRNVLNWQSLDTMRYEIVHRVNFRLVQTIPRLQI